MPENDLSPLDGWCICDVCRCLTSGKKPGDSCAFPPAKPCPGVLRQATVADVQQPLEEGTGKNA